MTATSEHKLFVANRGEIAVRIVRTAHKLGIPTIAIYTPADALSPHVSLATEAVALQLREGQNDASPYLDGKSLVAIAKQLGATLVHPGYGFLSENASFAQAVLDAGITFLGPRPQTMEIMGLKHQARAIAVKAGVNVVPGGDGEGLLETTDDAISVADDIGYPVLIKSTAGGGGMGMVVCNDEGELKEQFEATRQRAETLFHNDGVFLERYYASARHIEVQIFGNGDGHVIHMGERECSLQRRHQKVLEESPSPFLATRKDLRDEICAAAVRLCEAIKYGSAGTVEFLVDDPSGAYFFLEMNARVQVEHPVTEETHPQLDLVELMILQGIAEHQGTFLPASSPLLQQAKYDVTQPIHAIEARIYAENPAEGFRPSPGTMQHVDFSVDKTLPEWLRVDTWVSTGTTVTPFFDPLVAKLIVKAATRSEALTRLAESLASIKVQGPPTNISYLLFLLSHPAVLTGATTTRLLSNVLFAPTAITIEHPGLSTLVQDLPGRPQMLHGIPPSGPMDVHAHAVASVLAGNPPETEALEIISVRGAEFRARFWVPSVIGIAGGRSTTVINVNGQRVSASWARLIVPAGGILEITEEGAPEGGGFRVYVAVKGGFPDIPLYLGSKSTSMGYGGYQGRALAPGDQITIGSYTPTPSDTVFTLPRTFLPFYPTSWTLHVLPGPQDDPSFLSPAGNAKFYNTTWTVSSSSNRMGMRLSPTSSLASNERAILWARKTGGEGGSHPSNILDNAYARGSVNVNGDTPVILGCEGPDMGGYVCLCVVSEADIWKLGQLSPGTTLRFKRVSWAKAREVKAKNEHWLAALRSYIEGQSSLDAAPLDDWPDEQDHAQDARLRVITEPGRPEVAFRQAGDSGILVEYGPMTLDFSMRARIQAFETAVLSRSIPGIIGFAPCIRSTMCYFDTDVISQASLLNILVEVEAALPSSTHGMSFPGRRITLPIVLDDRWSREALDRYMQTTRNRAVYLPSNVEYLAKNNGLDSKDHALKKLVGTDFLIFGVGFYAACPFLVPIDPRCRLVGQKMNPSRTYTPRGSIGIAGPTSAIYPVDSPGGYQLYGRTLPGWHMWGRGKDLDPERPWLFRPFDQVHFEPVSETEYTEMEKDFDMGRYAFKIEPAVFSMSDYDAFVETIKEDTRVCRERQSEGTAREEAREWRLLREWEDEQRKANAKTDLSVVDSLSSAHTVVSSLSASIWRIKCQPGDVVKSPDETLVILEAMKTEIAIKAGAENVGRTVKGFGKGVIEGSVVGAGDILVVFE